MNSSIERQVMEKPIDREKVSSVQDSNFKFSLDSRVLSGNVN